MVENKVITRFQVVADQARAELKAQIKLYKLLYLEMNKQVSATGRLNMRAIQNTDAMKTIIANTIYGSRAFEENNKQATELGKKQAQVTIRNKKLADTMKKGSKNIKEQANSFKSLRNSYLMASLSALFFGMALKRIFEGILRSSVGTFTKIMESNDMFGSSTQRLAVMWEYLKFVIGSAIDRFLTPLMPTIEKIVNVISDWINLHPKLVAWTILAGAALGIFLFTVGTMGSFATGVKTFFSIFSVGAANSAGAAAGLSTKAAAAGTGATASGVAAAGAGLAWWQLALIILGVIVVLAILAKIFKDNKDIIAKDNKEVTRKILEDWKEIGSEFDELIRTVFPRFTGAWDLLSSTVVWLLGLLMLSFARFTSSVRSIMNATTSLFYALSGIAEALKYVMSFGKSGSMDTAASSINKAKDSWEKFKDSVKDSMDLQDDYDDKLSSGWKSLDAQRKAAAEQLKYAMPTGFDINGAIYGQSIAKDVQQSFAQVSKEVSEGFVLDFSTLKDDIMTTEQTGVQNNFGDINITIPASQIPSYDKQVGMTAAQTKTFADQIAKYLIQSMDKHTVVG